MPAAAQTFSDVQPIDTGQQTFSNVTPIDSAGKRFATNVLSGLGVTSNEAAKNFFRHPLDTVIHSFEAQGELAKKARDAYDQGDYMGALQHALNYLVPFVGQQADQAGEQLKSGDIAGGVGRTLGAAIPLVAGSPEVRAVASDAAATAASKGAAAVRAGARGVNAALKEAPGAAGAAIGGYLGHETGIPEGTLSGVIIGRELGKAAGKSLPPLRIPGEGFGFPSRVTGGPVKAPAFQPEAVNDFENPGAPLPETPSRELAQAQPLVKGGAAPQPEPAAGLGKIPLAKQKAAAIARAGELEPDREGVTSEQTEHAGEVNEEIPAETPAAKAAEPAPKPDTSPKKMGELLNQATGGRPLAKNVPLKDQIKAAVQAQAPLPEGFTRALSKNADTGELEPSDVLRGYQYDLAKREFTAITNTGQSYTHGDVSPEEVEAFENADSKGKAWNQLRSQNVQVAKNGRSTVPIARRSIVIDPETGQPEFSDVVAAKQAAAKAAPAKAAPQSTPSPQMDAMQQMLKRAKKGEKLADMKTQ